MHTFFQIPDIITSTEMHEIFKILTLRKQLYLWSFIKVPCNPSIIYYLYKLLCCMQQTQPIKKKCMKCYENNISRCNSSYILLC